MKREFSFKGFWVLIVCDLIASAAAWPTSPLRGLVAAAFGANRSEHSPVGYLRGYVANGACATGALFVVCVFAAMVWKRYPQCTTVGVCSAWVILTPQIIIAFAILWRCLNLASPTQAGSLLEDATLPPSAMWAGCYSGMALMLVLWCAQWLSSRRRAADDRPQAASVP
jgi:hypothetical protein